MWLSALNLSEAVDLLAAVSDFNFKSSEKRPDYYIYDNQNQGYTLWIKAQSVNPEYLSYVKKIVKSRKLAIHKSEGYLVIHEP